MHTSQLLPVAALAAALLTACGGGSGGSFGFTPLPITNAQPPAGPPSTDAPPAVRFDPALCTQQTGAPHGQTAGITGTNLMVTSAHYEASKAGCKILATGGSAIDAAIAVQAVLGTAEPFASGLGGGTLITYYDAASKKVQAYDGRETAPAAATANYLRWIDDANDQTLPKPGGPRASGRSIGTPGAVRMLDLAYQDHGKLPWKDLFGYGITLAADGFPIGGRKIGRAHV